MASPFLSQKIDETKDTLSGMSASELNDRIESTRGKFDSHMIADDRQINLGIFRSIHE